MGLGPFPQKVCKTEASLVYLPQFSADTFNVSITFRRTLKQIKTANIKPICCANTSWIVFDSMNTSVPQSSWTHFSCEIIATTYYNEAWWGANLNKSFARMELAWLFRFGLYFWMNNIWKMKHSSLSRHFSVKYFEFLRLEGLKLCFPITECLCSLTRWGR